VQRWRRGGEVVRVRLVVVVGEGLRLWRVGWCGCCCCCWEGLEMRLLVDCRAGRRGRGRMMGLLLWLLLVGVVVVREREGWPCRATSVVWMGVMEDGGLWERVGDKTKWGKEGVQGVVGGSMGDVWSCIVLDFVFCLICLISV
jgi:hypothetical protein